MIGWNGLYYDNGHKCLNREGGGGVSARSAISIRRRLNRSKKEERGHRRGINAVSLYRGGSRTIARFLTDMYGFGQVMIQPSVRWGGKMLKVGADMTCINCRER